MGTHRAGGFHIPRVPTPYKPRHGTDRVPSRGAVAASSKPFTPAESARLLAGGTVRGQRLTGPIGQPHKAGARESMTERQRGHGAPRQTRLTDRPEGYDAERRSYGAGSRGRTGKAFGARPARVEASQRAARTGARGRPAHTEYLPPGKGRAARPASRLPGTGEGQPNAGHAHKLSGGTFAGKMGYGT